MTSWGELAESEPEFMAAVTVRFDAHLHKFLATVRKDGSPRLSGIETSVRDGELWLAGHAPRTQVPGPAPRPPPRAALRLRRRRPRPTRRSGSATRSSPASPRRSPTPPRWPPTRARRSTCRPGDFELFRVDIRDAVLVRMGDPADHIVVTHWARRDGPDPHETILTQRARRRLAGLTAPIGAPSRQEHCERVRHARARARDRAAVSRRALRPARRGPRPGGRRPRPRPQGAHRGHAGRAGRARRLHRPAHRAARRPARRRGPALLRPARPAPTASTATSAGSACTTTPAASCSSTGARRRPSRSTRRRRRSRTT